jgi:Adenylyl/Guanylyl and SMODS C-terminal sensor domain/Second Messenger Oligonucleotide or Dinucleotide Synthetase domain
MTNIQEFAMLLSATANELDIPDELHQEAALKYEEVGIWLAAEGGSLANYAPDIYPQGSFRLGTVVRPIDAKCDYDIDLVCVIERQKASITQVDLKDMIGDRLRENTDYARRLSPSRRCWNLDFPKQFHLDVLPSIPNVEQDPNGILLTDTDLKNWQKSNPIDYADWFYESMKVQVQAFRESLAKSLSMSVEEVPEWQVKTPLQRAIQILKRHRDVRFRGDLENRPVSIILTTLAAHAYRGEDNIYDALLRLVTDMPEHIEVRSGRWWVQNPVEPGENFADKWNEKPERRDAFLKWLRDVEKDIKTAAGASSLDEAANLLKHQLVSTEVDSARAKLFQDGLGLASFSGKPTVPEVTSALHSQEPIWPVSPNYNASVKATLHYARGARRMSELARRRISKNLWIKFVAETTTPPPYKVFWKVVNNGVEARAAQQLRGTIFPDSSGLGNVLWEHTAYTGTHWVEAYVVKDGYCVATTGKKYVMVR